MKTSLAPGKKGNGPSRTARPLPTLKVFIGYADVPAVRRATGAVGETLRASGRRVELCPMLWRFEQLASSHWQDRAITAAMEADLIVLTSSVSAPLPAAIEHWVERFLNANRGRAITIVAISGESDAWTISLEQPLPRVAAATRWQDPSVAA